MYSIMQKYSSKFVLTAALGKLWLHDDEEGRLRPFFLTSPSCPERSRIEQARLLKNPTCIVELICSKNEYPRYVGNIASNVDTI